MPDTGALSAQRSLAARTLPHWSELPDFDIYMDQVLSLMERYLGSAAGKGGKALTASMVNNYVKTGIVPAPVKKRYSREHLAHLIVVCTLKQVLSLADIKTLVSRELDLMPTEAFYERFCEAFEHTEHDAASAAKPNDASALQAALRAQSEQHIASTLISTLTDTPEC